MAKIRYVVILRCPKCDPQETYWGFYELPEPPVDKDAFPKSLCELCDSLLWVDYWYTQEKK